ncbi:flavin reductase family protein [Streptomyces sp. NPDC002308]
MSLDLRTTMRTFATGVCVVTTFAEEAGRTRHDAVTAGSLVSVSLDPPLISLTLPDDCDALADLLATGVWAVSILDVAGDDLARAFEGDRETRARALTTCSTSPGPRTGALVIDAPGWLECALHESRRFGGNTLLIGEVLSTGGHRRRPPLVALDGAMRALGGV